MLPTDLVGNTTYYVDISGSPNAELTPGNYLMDYVAGASAGTFSNIRRITNGTACLLYTSPSPRDS